MLNRVIYFLLRIFIIALKAYYYIRFCMACQRKISTGSTSFTALDFKQPGISFIGFVARRYFGGFSLAR